MESIRIREYVGAIGDFTAPVWPVRLIMLIGLVVTGVTFLLLAGLDVRRARTLRTAAGPRAAAESDDGLDVAASTAAITGLDSQVRS